MLISQHADAQGSVLLAVTSVSSLYRAALAESAPSGIKTRLSEPGVFRAGQSASVVLGRPRGPEVCAWSFSCCVCFVCFVAPVCVLSPRMCLLLCSFVRSGFPLLGLGGCADDEFLIASRLNDRADVPC